MPPITHAPTLSPTATVQSVRIICEIELRISVNAVAPAEVVPIATIGAATARSAPVPPVPMQSATMPNQRFGAASPGVAKPAPKKKVNKNYPLVTLTHDKVMRVLSTRPTDSRVIGDKLHFPRDDRNARAKLGHILRNLCKSGQVTASGARGWRSYALSKSKGGPTDAVRQVQPPPEYAAAGA